MNNTGVIDYREFALNYTAQSLNKTVLYCGKLDGMKRTPVPGQRATLGFLLASLHTGASRALWPGLLDAAERHDVNLICFPGGRLKTTVAYEGQRNLIYDLAGEACLDGLVTWSSSLGGVVGPSDIQAFHQRYQNLPDGQPGAVYGRHAYCVGG